MSNYGLTPADEATTEIDVLICPNVHVKLVGQDGNAFAILGRVTRAMRQAKIAKGTIDAYMADATNGDYDHLLQTTMKYVHVI